MKLKGTKSQTRQTKLHKTDLHKAISRKGRQKMATEQSMTWAIRQATTEAAKVAIMAVKVEDNSVNSARSIHTICVLVWH